MRRPPLCSVQMQESTRMCQGKRHPNPNPNPNPKPNPDLRILKETEPLARLPTVVRVAEFIFLSTIVGLVTCLLCPGCMLVYWHYYGFAEDEDGDGEVAGQSELEADRNADRDPNHNVNLDPNGR